MAKKTIILDDLDERLEADGTILFAVDGDCYEIDLAEKNAKPFRDSFAKYISAARQISAREFARRVTSAENGTGDFDPAVVREWARQRGIKINDKGRVPEDIVKQWRDATQQQAGTAGSLGDALWSRKPLGLLRGLRLNRYSPAFCNLL
jgi:hypothetical protein